MSRQHVRIDWVAPPFAGHLFPMLQIAKGLCDMGFTGQRIYSTPSMRSAVESLSLEFRPILTQREAAILEVANGDARVGSRPTALVAQLRRTLGFLNELGVALESEWKTDAPDVAIVDSVLPSAGFVARAAGARWWTSMASIAPTETRQGTPAYLGGWTQRSGALFRVRDALGRGATRVFKRSAAWLVRHELRAMGVASIYRRDGTEVCYSDDRILALGHEAFEFARDWPDAMRFVGYPTGSPVRGGNHPLVMAARPTLLVTLGTHLLWAKTSALDCARALASVLPDWDVHFSHGDANGTLRESSRNFTELSYVPYGANLSSYTAICHHGGAGITYAAIRAGVPSVVWPRDFDQFDHAARVVDRGVGLRTKGDIKQIAAMLERLTDEPTFRERTVALAQKVSARDPVAEVARLLEERCD